MKRMIMLMLGLLLISATTVHASPYSELFPGGKNYLEEDNLLFDRDTVSTIDPIRVHPSTQYTLWFPPLGLWDYAYVEVTNGQDILLDGFAHELSECTTDTEITYCTFLTTDEMLELTITSQGIGQYYDFYGMTDIQLEEGTTPTAYEDYIVPVIDVNGPEFSGSATFVKSYEETITIADIIQNHIYVYDTIDGNVTSSIVVTNDLYTENMYTTGQYTATLTASDSSGNETSMILNVLIKDEIAPTIEGPTTVSVPVDSPPAIETILADNYAAIDGYDGALELTIDTDLYTAAMNQVGSYQVVLGTEDNSGNTASKAIVIEVLDTIAPEVLSDLDMTFYTSEDASLLDVLDNVIIGDNFDSAQDITMNVLFDDYSTHEAEPGVYLIQIELEDLSGNKAGFDLGITVIDDISPVISGPTTISLSYTIAPTLEDVLSQLTLTDNVDTFTTTNLEITEDTYTTRTTQTGTFSIAMSLTDAAGNIANHTIEITLIDDQGPTIYVDNYMVTVTSQASFEPQDALNMMIQNNELDPGDYEIVTLLDQYTDNRFTPGMYTYQLQFINQKGEMFDKEFLIHVTTPVEESTTSWKTTARHIISYTITAGAVGVVLYRMKK